MVSDALGFFITTRAAGLESSGFRRVFGLRSPNIRVLGVGFWVWGLGFRV